MPIKVKTDEGMIAVCTVAETAHLLNIPEREIEHYIHHHLLSAFEDRQTKEWWIGLREIKAVKDFSGACPPHWSGEQVMWYRFLMKNREVFQRELWFHQECRVK